MTTKPRETQIEDLIQRLELAKAALESWCASSRDQAFNAVYREWRDCRPEKIALLIQSTRDELSALLREEAPAKSGCQHMYSSGRTCGRHAGDAVHVSDAIDCGDLSVFNTHRYVAPPERLPMACCAYAPDRSGRSCDKQQGHDGPHWSYGGSGIQWPKGGEE